MASRNEPAKVLRQLSTVGDKIRKLDDQLAELYKVRTGLFMAGRSLDKPLTYASMGEAAGVGDLAVGAMVRRHLRETGSSPESENPT